MTSPCNQIRIKQTQEPGGMLRTSNNSASRRSASRCSGVVQRFSFSIDPVGTLTVQMMPLLGSSVCASRSRLAESGLAAHPDSAQSKPTLNLSA
jgi:hypothetical protein